MNEETVSVDDIDFKSKGKFVQKWIENRMSGKICFLASVSYMLITYLLLMIYPNIVLSMYCVAYPILFILRVYSYVKSKSFLFLFDNCYFVNTALIIFLWVNMPLNTVFLPIFVAANGPVLWAVLPFRNTLAYHDLDKITSCFIHWAPPIVTWSVRWFPQKTSVGWFRTFLDHDININPIYKWHPTADWMWLIVIPFACLSLHDIIYAIIVHVIIRPNEIYSDSFTYQRSRLNFIGTTIRQIPEKFQLGFYMLMGFAIYFVGISIAIVSYHVFLVHCILLVLQTSIIAWNGGCYYLDYFAYLAIKAQKTDEANDKIALTAEDD